MAKSGNKDIASSEEIIERLNSIENRLASVESLVESITNVKFKSGRVEVIGSEEDEQDSTYSQFSSRSIENVVGEQGLGWIGNIVLLFGLTFLTQLLQSKGNVLLGAIVGYVSVFSIFLLSYLIRNSYANMARMFTFLGHFLLYYFTFRLHFLSNSPLIESKTLCLTLLLIINAAQFYVAIKRKSTILAGISMVLAMTTAIASDSTHVMLSIPLAVAAVAVYLLYRFEWRFLLFFSLALVYLTMAMWFINNPIMGHTASIVKAHGFSYVYLLAIASIYSMISFIPRKEKITENLVNGSIIMNGLGFTSMLILFVITFFSTSYSFIFVAIFIIGFSFAILLKVKSPWSTSHALYALYSFVALSVAVYGIFDLPYTFLLLAIESILVIGIALWFRSKLIVFLNTGLYLMLLFTYLTISESLNLINFSFAIVALISAVILKWQQDRLESKTGFLQNVYLFTGFILVLYSLYKALPGQYVTLSWTFVAILYFVISIIISNAKYRWLAIATFIATAVYLFVVDLARIDPIYRIIAFLALAIFTIVVSTIYTKRKKSSSE